MAKPATTKSKAQQQAEEPSDEDQHQEEVEEAVRGSDAEEQEDENENEDEDGEGDEPASGSDDDDSDGSVDVGENDEYPVDGDEEDGEEEEELEAVGFGDAMSKILQQNVGEDAAPILAKRTTARMREIQNEKQEIKKDRVGAAEKRAKERKDNVVPSHATATKDRQLRKIATKGVVALFNAISKHQHQTGKIADKDDKKVKELSKENFLGLLKGSAQKDKTPAKTEESKSSWSVLQDDYMMGAKLKDWDATHANNDAGRARRRGNDKDQEDDSDPEAAEEKAWKQVGALGNDDEDGAATSKRKPRANASTQKKKVKRT